MAGLEAFHSAKFASACEFHLDEYLDEVVKEEDDHHELCDGEQQDQRKEKRTRQGRIGVHQIFLSDIIAARQFVHAASLEKRLR